MCEKHYYYKDGRRTDSQVEQCSKAARHGPNAQCEEPTKFRHPDGELPRRGPQYAFPPTPPQSTPSSAIPLGRETSHTPPQSGPPSAASYVGERSRERSRKRRSGTYINGEKISRRSESRGETRTRAYATLVEPSTSCDSSSDDASSRRSPTYRNHSPISPFYTSHDQSDYNRPRHNSSIQYEQITKPKTYSVSSPEEERLRQKLKREEKKIEEAKRQIAEAKRQAEEAEKRADAERKSRKEVERERKLENEIKRENAIIESRPPIVQAATPYRRGSVSIKQSNTPDLYVSRSSYNYSAQQDPERRRRKEDEARQSRLRARLNSHSSYDRPAVVYQSRYPSERLKAIVERPVKAQRSSEELEVKVEKHVEEDMNSILLILLEESDEELDPGFESLVEEKSSSQMVAGQTLDKDSDQPEATTHGVLMSPKPEAVDLSEKEERAKATQCPWIARVWYWLASVLDPPLEHVDRATYTCSCGEFCYIDMEELMPGGSAELEQEIRKEADFVRYRNPDGNTSPRNNIQKPPAARLNASTLSTNGAQGAPVQSLPTLSEQSQGHNITDSAIQEPPSDTVPTAQKYLLLCVHTRHGLVKLVHIDVSALTNDQFLFQEIRNEYKTARRGHDWNLAELIPFKFELMPVRLEICAGNIEKPEIPGPEEVQVKRTYEYEPITIKAKILNVPIHELLKPGQHLNRFWWKRFPKKLDNPLTFNDELDCCGWGILITEGWNRPFVLFLCLLAMIVFVIFVTLYSVLTNDGSTGAGIGSFMMAILTLYCTLKYEQ